MDLCLWAMVFPEKSLQAFRRRCRAGCWKRTMWYWWKPTERHGFPLKCPASFEPVIPVETDLVIGVAGASAVGKSFREKCHRSWTACQSLGRLPEDLITEQDVIRCLTEKFGQKKNVDCEYRYVVNQAEVLSKKQMERLLYFQKSQTDIGVVISFSMERWYNS